MNTGLYAFDATDIQMMKASVKTEMIRTVKKFDIDGGEYPSDYMERLENIMQKLIAFEKAL